MHIVLDNILQLVGSSAPQLLANQTPVLLA